MQTYRLSIGYLFFVAFATVILTLVSGSFAVGLMQGELTLDIALFFAAWCAFLVGWLVFTSRRFVYRIDTTSDGSVTFFLPIGRVRATAHEIESIGTAPWDVFHQTIRIRVARRKLWMPNAVDGFFDFVSFVRERNPAIRVQRL